MRDVWGIKRSPNIFEGLCKKFVVASLLYYRHDFSATTDSQFDNWALTLRMKYPELPQWFRDRVTYGDLAAGTGYAITATDDERDLCDEFLTGRLNHNHYF